MRIVTGICLFFIWSYSLLAQSATFNKAYSFGNQAHLGVAIKAIDSSYIAIAQFYDNGNRKLGFIKTNQLGDTLFSKVLSFDSTSVFTGFSSLIHTVDSHLIFVGNIYSQVYDNTNAYMVKFNYEGDTLWYKEYGNTIDQEVFYDVIQLADNSYMATGTKGINNNLDVWLVNLDAFGNLLWEKTYGGGNDDEAYSIAMGVDNGYVIGGYTERNGVGNRDAYVLKVNNSGTFQWDTTYGYSNGDACWVLSSENQLGYLIYGGISPDGLPKNQGFYKMLNSNGTTRWEGEYGYTNDQHDLFQAAIELEDGTFALAGLSMDVDSLNNPMGWIMKIAANGDSLWSRRYSIRTNDHYLTDIIETENKGLLACGYVFPDGTGNTEDVWLLKVDSMGCLEENCHVTTLPETTTTEELKVFPNPFSNVLTVSNSTEIKQVIIYGLSGRTVLQLNSVNSKEITLSTDMLNPGVYIVEVLGNRQEFTRKRIVKY